MEKSTITHLGRGVLTWNSVERVSDRYGTFHLIDLEDTNEPPSFLMHSAIVELERKNSYGTITAKIISTRQSTHIGDIFRGFKPTIPKVDDVILLGAGFLFSQKYSGILSIGLRPTMHRKSDWLIPKNLYKCHEQTVDIFFQPEIVNEA